MAKGTRNTGKSIFEKNVNDAKIQGLLNDFVLSKEAFKNKYHFDRTSIFTILDDLRDKYPEEKLKILMKNNESMSANIYVSQKRIKDAKEIRIKVAPEVYEDYKFLMLGYKDTLKPEIFSEILSRGMKGLLERKKNGESIVRVAAIEEKEL